jgi:hypothetical protein
MTMQSHIQNRAVLEILAKTIVPAFLPIKCENIGPSRRFGAIHPIIGITF